MKNDDIFPRRRYALLWIEDPATIELVALVGFDHSRLYLVSARDGETKIAHRRMDGTTVAWSGHSQ